VADIEDEVRPMAFMRMMGADSVAYHRETVIERSDDHPGVALSYYTDRGESPLTWGGVGAARLGLVGHVRPEHYEDMFGPGGARDPITGQGLTATKRPGMELVVSAHKSVAELGVIGRVEDMHALLDAETAGTMAYLDALTQQAGGRRGRAATVSETSGLVYASTRHATSRAGDPCPHDHVLIANAVEMLDARGGWKAPDTTTWREHMHAATAYGRICAAKVAVDLGYGIVPDHGPSGRLGHWAIAGIPDEAMTLHSKRSAEIDDEMVRVGFDSYRARGHAARNSRTDKRHQPVEDLMRLWRSELTEIGLTADDMSHAVADSQHVRITHDLTAEDVQALAIDLLGPEGRLAAQKVFSRRDVVVAAAPHLFGLDPGVLGHVVDRVLADPAAIPLVGVRGAKQRAYVPACVLAAEQAIAAVVEAGRTRLDAAHISDTDANQAMIETQRALGGILLTKGQQAAVSGICTSGHGVDLVLGVAGAGKTTALNAVRLGFEDAGYTVVGTATSGQAARTLGRDAGIETSSTLASLLWRLDHRRTQLDANTVVILDEAGMTDDTDLLRLLTVAGDAGAKVVMVGDDRQLGAVGPGGGLGALIERHEPGVWALDQNVRQADPTERVALDELRAGAVDAAVDWMVGHGRIVTAPDRAEVIGAVVDAWIADVDAGRDTMMLAWQRRNVDSLNEVGREAFADRGLLTGPELKAPGGRRYQAGDRIVTLAPGARGEIVTSERGTIASVDVEDGSMRARMDDGRLQHFPKELTARDHMAHGYAITVHRSQGATVDTAHRLEDGGGRELAYVSMSRARNRSTVYVIADDADLAAHDLGREWSVERRQRWAIDTGTPVTDPVDIERDPLIAPTVRHALSHARLEAERAAIEATIPTDVSIELRETRAALAEVRQSLVDLEAGTGEWRDTKVGDVARVSRDLEQRRKGASWRVKSTHGKEHRTAKRSLRDLDSRIDQASVRFEALAEPHRESLGSTITSLEIAVADLEQGAIERNDWLAVHPETARRLDRVEGELVDAGRWLDTERNELDGVVPAVPGRVPRTHTRELLDHLPAPEPQAVPWWGANDRGGEIGLGL
jgi:conjugative relaxase-like TrwC/TraI family protein